MDKHHRIDALIEVMARLRDPDGGCPWDRQQTFATIAPYTLEEAYEVADAIARDEMEELRDELGDLLFQVVFHARMAEEAGHFTFPDVVEAIVDKMIRRHPHVFGDAEIADAEAQTLAWEKQKASERKAKAANEATHSVLDGVAVALPALVRAEKIQKRAARVGFDWPDLSGVYEKILEEIDEVKAEVASGDETALNDEIGDLLFAVVNLARRTGVDPEMALQGANRKFEKRFRLVEQYFGERSVDMKDLDIDELDAAWEQAKRRDRQE